MIEAEIKARLSNSDEVRRRLERLASGVRETYSDTYFDTPDQLLATHQRELRVRTVAGPTGIKHRLTFKDQPVDTATQSKPEVEIAVNDPAAAAAILTGLGFPAELAFSKECVNFKVDRDGRRFLATMVNVPEIEGTFLEVETQAHNDEVETALNAVRSLLAELGVAESEWTTESYTDAVRTARIST